MSSAPNITVYPCDKGTGYPSGYHYFQANSNGIVVCVLCGKRGGSGD